ncbi:Rabenosyn-5-like [Oopsacas minuta]|uniref:Rabenosyn-5-like n=1 Tax=Oopsacas minuta TaxID=111878 RepID=A0AAV7JN69_9METZ|nr:Rabenosyn-5-like [Oopsacas minuta]
MAEEVCLEGYICPHCMEDQGSMTGLQQHFEDVHSQKRSFTTLFRERESPSFVKGLIGKAREKFTSSSSFSQSKSLKASIDYSTEEENTSMSIDSSSAGVPSTNPSGISNYCWEPQEIGSSRCFMNLYRPLRDKYVDQLTVETNKVLIRLGKMMSMKTATISSPSEKKMRKLEMEVVQWQSDKDGKYCAICSKKLLLASKHHCRLCGFVICGGCSMFLPMPIAMLLEKTNKQCLDEQACKGALRKAKEQAREMNGKSDNAVRLCTSCNAIIDKRIQRLESVHTRPRLSLLYASICDMMREVDVMLPKYESMVSGIFEGKIEHTSDEAKRMRFSILQLYESIDIKSKKVMALLETPVNSGSDAGAEEIEYSPRQLRLHKGVRSFSVKYLQERIACLPNVPSDAEIAKIRKKREEERVMSKSFRQSDKSLEANPSKPRSQSHLLSTGWVASSTDNTALEDVEEDPYILQLRLLRGYLSQAEKEGREDEVLTLTQEVNMLLSEIDKRGSSSYKSNN